jgi:hypothetical protein
MRWILRADDEQWDKLPSSQIINFGWYIQTDMPITHWEQGEIVNLLSCELKTRTLSIANGVGWQHQCCKATSNGTCCSTSLQQIEGDGAKSLTQLHISFRCSGSSLSTNPSITDILKAVVNALSIM